jgi:hypothetical protein
VTEITGRNSEQEQRDRWTKLLRVGWMFHQQQVKDLHSPIKGAKKSDDELFHMAISVAIQDAIELIQELEVYGFFTGNDEDEELSRPGLAG